MVLAATAGSAAFSLSVLRFRGQVLNRSLRYTKNKPWLVGAGRSWVRQCLSCFSVGRGCRQRCRVNALTLLPVSPGLMLLAVCGWHGALMCSSSWCRSWLRRAKLSCSPCWGCMDAEGSRKAKCPAAVSLGFSEVEVWGAAV